MVPKACDVEMGRLSISLLACSVFRWSRPRRRASFWLPMLIVDIFLLHPTLVICTFQLRADLLAVRDAGERGVHLRKHPGCLFGWFLGRLMGRRCSPICNLPISIFCSGCDPPSWDSKNVKIWDWGHQQIRFPRYYICMVDATTVPPLSAVRY